MHLAGQKAAQARIFRERIKTLKRLSKEESLAHYLDLWASVSQPIFANRGPSLLLLALRKALAKKEAYGETP